MKIGKYRSAKFALMEFSGQSMFVFLLSYYFKFCILKLVPTPFTVKLITQNCLLRYSRTGWIYLYHNLEALFFRELISFIALAPVKFSPRSGSQSLPVIVFVVFFLYLLFGSCELNLALKWLFFLVYRTVSRFKLGKVWNKKKLASSPNAAASRTKHLERTLCNTSKGLPDVCSHENFCA